MTDNFFGILTTFLQFVTLLTSTSDGLKDTAFDKVAGAAKAILLFDFDAYAGANSPTCTTSLSYTGKFVLKMYPPILLVCSVVPPTLLVLLHL